MPISCILTHPETISGLEAGFLEFPLTKRRLFSCPRTYNKTWKLAKHYRSRREEDNFCSERESRGEEGRSNVNVSFPPQVLET